MCVTSWPESRRHSKPGGHIRDDTNAWPALSEMNTQCNQSLSARKLRNSSPRKSVKICTLCPLKICTVTATMNRSLFPQCWRGPSAIAELLVIVVSTEKSKKLTQTFWGCLRLLHLKCHHNDGMHTTHSFIASDRSTVSSKLAGLKSILSLCGKRAWILGEHHQGNCKRDCLLCRHMHKAAFTSRELK